MYYEVDELGVVLPVVGVGHELWDIVNFLHEFLLSSLSYKFLLDNLLKQLVQYPQHFQRNQMLLLKMS